MLTGIIIAKNEEQTIDRAIASLKFCDEILVVDNNSTDSTSVVSHNACARVISSSITNDFAQLRNTAVSSATDEWMLFLDADEVISDDLRINIKHELEDAKYSSYYLRRRDHFWGKILEHGEVSSVYERGIIRLMKKGSGTWQGSIHETWQCNSEVGEIDGFIEHHPHPDISSFLESINDYSTIRAQGLIASGKKVGPLQLVSYPVGKFFYTYFLKGGYRDGVQGFIYSFMMSFHSFLVRAKVLTDKSK